MAESAIRLFGWEDYAVCVALLVVSAVIGIFYAIRDSKQKSTVEYLFGGKTMGTFPMAMSLFASFVSGIALLGLPLEIYNFGTMYCITVLSSCIAMPVVAIFYMPIFYKLQLVSVFEYLELRFHRSIRIIGSLLFSSHMCLYMALVVYAPAITLNQVTGGNVFILVSAIFLVCIFYTTLGGIKAVVWTDTLQVFVMFGSLAAVIIKGSMDVGGASFVWQKSVETDRIEFLDFNPDPTVRNTFWGLIIGTFFGTMSLFGINQAQVQRYLTVPSLKKARSALIWKVAASALLVVLCGYIGLILFARYSECDPISSKQIKNSAQLLPSFVMETLGQVPGAPGLFVAGILSGALSTVSSGLNSLAASTLEDFVKPNLRLNYTPRLDATISQILAVSYGLVSFSFVFLVANVKHILEASLAIGAVFYGPMLGIYNLGLFLPWSNALGAGVGGLTSLAFMLWIGFGTQASKAQGILKDVTKSLSVAGCTLAVVNNTQGITDDMVHGNQTYTLFEHNMNATATDISGYEEGGVLGIYQLSYLWYNCLGCNLTILIGMLVSWLTGFEDVRKLNPALVCNFGEIFKPILPERICKILTFGTGESYVPPQAAIKEDEKASREPSIYTIGGSTQAIIMNDLHEK